MDYVLITPKGKIFTFYIKEVALSYYYAYGGKLTKLNQLDKEKTMA